VHLFVCYTSVMYCH